MIINVNSLFFLLNIYPNCFLSTRFKDFSIPDPTIFPVGVSFDNLRQTFAPSTNFLYSKQENIKDVKTRKKTFNDKINLKST